MFYKDCLSGDAHRMGLVRDTIVFADANDCMKQHASLFKELPLAVQIGYTAEAEIQATEPQRRNSDAQDGCKRELEKCRLEVERERTAGLHEVNHTSASPWTEEDMETMCRMMSSPSFSGKRLQEKRAATKWSPPVPHESIQVAIISLAKSMSNRGLPGPSGVILWCVTGTILGIVV